MKFIRFLALCLVADSSFAAELAGISFPEQIEVQGKKLQLNGMGKREATFFKVEVYVAGLYLEKKSSDAQSIIKSMETKKLRLVFLRNLSQKEIIEAFHDNLPKNCWTDCEQIKAALGELDSAFADLAKGQELNFLLTPTILKIEIPGRAPALIKNLPLIKNFLGMWLGPKPPNKSLRAGLLGV